MSLTEGLLVVIVIILIIRWCGKDKQVVQIVKDTAQDVKAAVVGDSAKADPETATTKENMEYFGSCKRQEQYCQCDEDIAKEPEDFGQEGLTYMDWVTSQAVDNQVIKNHSAFVSDMVKNKVAGRTYAFDDFESDTVHWQGLRRPQAVPVNNPDQVPDINMKQFAQKNTLVWRTGQ